MAATERYDVFIVHSDADEESVEFLARKLRSAGVRPFLASWDLVPGTERQEGLEQALEESCTCAVFFGTQGLAGWDNKAMRAALDRRTDDAGFRVIPVMLPGAPTPDKATLPRFLQQLVPVVFRRV